MSLTFATPRFMPEILEPTPETKAAIALLTQGEASGVRTGTNVEDNRDGSRTYSAFFVPGNQHYRTTLMSATVSKAPIEGYPELDLRTGGMTLTAEHAGNTLGMLVYTNEMGSPVALTSQGESNTETELATGATYLIGISQGQFELTPVGNIEGINDLQFNTKEDFPEGIAWAVGVLRVLPSSDRGAKVDLKQITFKEPDRALNVQQIQKETGINLAPESSELKTSIDFSKGRAPSEIVTARVAARPAREGFGPSEVTPTQKLSRASREVIELLGAPTAKAKTEFNENGETTLIIEGLPVEAALQLMGIKRARGGQQQLTRAGVNFSGQPHKGIIVQSTVTFERAAGDPRFPNGIGAYDATATIETNFWNDSDAIRVTINPSEQGPEGSVDIKLATPFTEEQLAIYMRTVARSLRPVV